MATASITTDDLCFARDWIRSYSAEGDRELADRQARVTAWLGEQIVRREVAEYMTRLVREVSRETGHSAAKIRGSQMFAKQRAEKEVEIRASMQATASPEP